MNDNICYFKFIASGVKVEEKYPNNMDLAEVILIGETAQHIEETFIKSAENFINENGKRGINLLVTLLVISLLTGFNYFIGISFIIVFVYTAKNIYNNFRQF